MPAVLNLPKLGRYVACLALLATVVGASADEPGILASIESFFAAEDRVRQQEIAAKIENDPVYDRARVEHWLNRADLFEPHAGGTMRLQVAIGRGTQRQVVVRIPADYTPAKPWPLIYALHGTGGNGAQIIRFVERLLGKRVDEFIVAAPSGYGQAVIHSEGPETPEHPAILRAVRTAVHIDSDRIYGIGYSLGGHTAWTLAVLHADQFAGVVPLAGTFNIMGVDALWEVFLPNIRHTHLLHVWGVGDRRGPAGEVSPQGGIAGVSRMLRDRCAALDLQVVAIEDPEKGHGGIMPPADALETLLTCRRVRYPKSFAHTFRWTYQSPAYWVEGHAWRGKHWDEKPLTVNVRNNEDPQAAYYREVRGRLGQLRGSIDGQTIDVRRRKITSLTVWVGDGMIDWTQDVTIKVSGRKVFAGRLTPSLFVCLTQAKRTGDLQRLRWAGLRFESGRKARLVGPETKFSELVTE